MFEAKTELERTCLVLQAEFSYQETAAESQRAGLPGSQKRTDPKVRRIPNQAARVLNGFEQLQSKGASLTLKLVQDVFQWISHRRRTIVEFAVSF